MSKKIILSGMKPSGELHIGNYLGALRNFVKLQDEYQCYFFIATYHSMTEWYDHKTRRQQIIDLARAYLAAGLDPDKCVIFDQADIMEHCELGWIFDCLTPVAEAQRMTQFKDKSQKNVKDVNMGLLTYPILQAADILLYHANTVPVGADQVQHVEITRKIARWFNNRFGEYFPEPEPLLTKIPKVQSLTSPEKKMSKSDGPASYIALTDEEKTIEAKIKKAVTGTGTEDSIPAGADNLLNIIEELGELKIAKKYRADIAAKSIRYGDLKNDAAQIISDSLKDFRTTFKSLSDKEVLSVLAKGAKSAKAVAEKTMVEVRKLTGIK